MSPFLIFIGLTGYLPRYHIGVIPYNTSLLVPIPFTYVPDFTIVIT